MILPRRGNPSAFAVVALHGLLRGKASLAMTDLLKLKMSQSINRLLCLACDLRGNLGKILACTGVDDGA